MAVDLLVLAAEALESPESKRNVDSGVAADFVGAAGRIEVALEEKSPPVVLVDRKA